MDLVEIRIKNSVVISRFVWARDQMVRAQPQGYINCRLFVALSSTYIVSFISYHS